MKKIKKVKIAVVGVGHLGKHHVKHYSKLDNVDLVGVFDTDLQVSKSIAKKYKVKNFKDYNELIEYVDAVSIVTPTKTHYEVSKFFLNNKKHVLIEKPITSTVLEADDLIKIANSNKVLIQVGHIERFNPALFPLRELELDPKYLEIQRLAPYTSRGTDVPVVLDLMIHDIDLALSLVNSNVKSINANGVSIMTNSIDIANARIKFENGSIANITSSRIAKDKVRKIKLFQQDLYITIDFLASITEIYRAMDANQKDEKAICIYLLLGVLVFLFFDYSISKFFYNINSQTKSLFETLTHFGDSLYFFVPSILIWVIIKIIQKQHFMINSEKE